MVENLSLSVWVMLSVILGGGIDYIRVRRVDKRVLCFFTLLGLIAGNAFQLAGRSWGAGAGLLAALAAALALTAVSGKFIMKHIVSTRRETEEERASKWKREFEALEKEFRGGKER